MLRLTSVVAALFALSLLAGCGGSGGSSSGTGAQLSISPSTSLTFASTAVGQTSASQVLTLTNTGNATLTASSYTVTGASADFTFTSASTCGTSLSLAPSASCQFTIVFAPQTSGTLTATITLTDNASNSPQTVTLTGGGTAAPQLTITPSPLSFPSTLVGQTSGPQVLTLTNTGNATLMLNGEALTGNSADFISATTTCGSSLEPSASCSFPIVFAPQTSGTLAATFTITDNAANSPQTVAFTGIGAPVLIPQATLSLTSINFSTANVTSTSAAQSITLTNTGTATLSISSIALGGTSPTDFAATNTCNATLAPGLSCQISVTFSPAAVATYGATLIITDNSGNLAGSTQSVVLQGTGTPAPAPQLTFAPATVPAFSTTTVGQTSASQLLMLTNSGNATLNLTGIALGGTNPTDFTETNNCTATLAAGASCTITLAFAPQATGTLKATLTLTDNAANSPQPVALSGTATAGPTPQGTLTPGTGLVFPTTASGNTSATQVVTLTNTGNATLSITGIAIGGANPSDFAETNACPATLAVGSNCQITVSFAPAAAASYTAALIVTDNAGNALLSTQSVPLKGIGSSGPVTVTHTLDVFPEIDKSVTPLYTLINSAKSTIDMTMYKFEDTTFLSDLVAACANKVTVRVLLDGGTDTKSINTSAYTQLNTSGTYCSAEFSNTAFQATHQKTITVDGTTTAIMTLNLQSQYYATSRDFALVENDPADIAAIEATFNADYAAGSPYGGTQGASDFANQGGPGDDLIWSPTTATSNPLAPRTAEADMLGIITGATKTLLIENEELSSSSIVTALETACSKNKVTVNLVMSEDSTTPPLSPYVSNWLALEVAGCGVHVYADTTTGLYIHAKAVVADYGLSTQNAYVGSINYSVDSLTENRELGLYVTDPTAVTLLNTTMSADYAGGVVFQGGIVF
ncbi:MAG TPA: choice-of-anchor D domain-containing protein [Granulicella sp.]|jgi:phosphatidylserine/phosphatidylglycerophosphate/cardiolipin synthase-like enzyme